MKNKYLLFCILCYISVPITAIPQHTKQQDRLNQEWKNRTQSFNIVSCINDTLSSALKKFIEQEKACPHLNYCADSLMLSIDINERSNKYILIINFSEFKTDILVRKPLAVTIIDDTPCFISKEVPLSLFLDENNIYIYHYKERNKSVKSSLPLITPEDSPYSRLRCTLYKNGLFHIDSEHRPCLGIYED